MQLVLVLIEEVEVAVLDDGDHMITVAPTCGVRPVGPPTSFAVARAAAADDALARNSDVAAKQQGEQLDVLKEIASHLYPTEARTAAAAAAARAFSGNATAVART